MPMIVSLLSKSFHVPDEVRSPEKTRVDVVHLDDVTLGRFTFAPGWRWSTCIQPVAGTESCQVTHVGYAVAGQVRIHLDDGSEQTIRAGDAHTIPPGHDAWVEGDEPFVGIEVMSAAQFARPAAPGD